MFLIAFENVALTLLYILPGFALCKAKKALSEHLSSVSAVLVYVLSPCMIVSSFLKMDFSLKNFGYMWLFFAVTLVLQIAFMLIIWLIIRKKRQNPAFRVLTIGSVMGNVGFFGLPIITALFPENAEVMCYSAMYVFSMNLLVFTVGVFCLTGEKKYMSVKNLILNPTTVAIALSMPLYIFGVGRLMQDNGLGLFVDAITLLGRATTPLCMIILGIRLASVSFKGLFCRPLVYLDIALKLIVFPLFCYLTVYFIPIDVSFKASVLILSAVPCASVILNLAEMHDGEKELSANILLLSTLACFITIPLLAMLI